MNATAPVSNLHYETEETPDLPVRVILDTSSPIHILDETTDAHPVLRFENTSGVPQEIDIEIDIHDYWRNSRHFSKRLKLTPEGSVSWWPESIPIERGMFWVDYRLTNVGGDGAVGEGQRAFAVMVPAGPLGWHKEPFLYGVCGGSRPSLPEEAYEYLPLAVATAGYNIVRADFHWDSIEPADNEWRWEHYDRVIEGYYRQGVEMQVLLSYNTRWAAPKELQNTGDRRDWLFAPPDLGLWKRYVTNVVNRYKDKVRYWEVWNEADIVNFWPGTYEQYADLLELSYKTIKAIDPDAQVMTSGFATLFPHNGRKDREFQAKVIEHCQDWFDIHAHHEHGIFGNFRWVVDNPLQEVRKKLKSDKPLYFNETAINSGKIGERAQAAKMVRKVVFTRSRGAIGYNWYNLKTGGNHHWGVITQDYYPRAVYVAHNTLVNMLKGLDFETELDCGDESTCAFVFGKGDTRTVAAWTDANPETTEPLLLEVGGASITAVDLMGRETAVSTIDGHALLPVGPTPAYLRLTGCDTPPRLAGRLLKSDWTLSDVRGSCATVNIELTNPLDREISVALSLAPVDNTAIFAREDIILAAGASETREMQIDIPAPAGRRFGDSFDVNVTYAVKDTNWHGAVPLSITLPVCIPTMTEGREPDFLLNRYEQVVNLCDNVPQLDYLLWRGPFDLSAKVWLGCGETDLLLRVEVEDNIHVQPYDGAELCKGDSVQIGLACPDQEGWWDILFARGDDGAARIHAYATPDGFDTVDHAASLTTERTEDPDKDNPTRPPHSFTHYNITIPLASLGLDRNTVSSGLRFNLQVNDNDTNLRKGWIAIAPGLGFEKSTERFPVIIFD